MNAIIYFLLEFCHEVDEIDFDYLRFYLTNIFQEKNSTKNPQNDYLWYNYVDSMKENKVQCLEHIFNLIFN